MTALQLERRYQHDKTGGGGGVMITPAIDEDYWAYRVRLTGKQAIIGFPKFGTVGIGFAVEEDWNTNFPYTVDAEETYDHIEHNKGDDAISREDCLEAIRLIQAAVREDKAKAAREQIPAIKAALDKEYAKAAEAQTDIKRLTALLIEAAGGAS